MVLWIHQLIKYVRLDLFIIVSDPKTKAEINSNKYL